MDPLAHAVENAWRQGIVVVAAAGNDGTGTPALLMPAADPYVIAVGAVDHHGHQLDPTTPSPTSPTRGTRRGARPPRARQVRRVPAGAGLVRRRDAPRGPRRPETPQRFFRGSGTSQATAVVSGAVALLLEARPGLTPDQVKAILRGSAAPLKNHPDPAMGAGTLDIEEALDTRAPSTTSARQSWPASTGLGSLEESRGGEHVIDPVTGVELTGETDALGDAWNPAVWAGASAAGTAWRGGVWGTRPWIGQTWTSAGWDAVQWTGASWSAVQWADHTWSEAYWEARSWRDDSWLARSWRGGTWEARSWRSDSWLARSWRSESFLARSWRSTD